MLLAVNLSVAGTYATGVFDEGAAEIVDYYSNRLFINNADEAGIDVVDITDISNPSLLFTIPVAANVAADKGSDFDAPTSVAVNAEGLVAVAVPADPTQDPGAIAFYDIDGNYFGAVTVGSLPDSVHFTPDGTLVLSPNEGEPNEDYDVDPEGSVSIVAVNTILNDGDVSSASVSTAGFTDFNDDLEQLLAEGVRIFGPGATVAQDLEPEYIAISADSGTAWVTLQENNALAVVDINTATVTDILPLGYKDHSLAGNGFDASNQDGGVHILNWPVLGMYMPDQIAAYEFQDATYLVTANEGDARDYDGFSEEARVGDFPLWGETFDDYGSPGQLRKNDKLGRLTTTTSFPTTFRGNGRKGALETAYAFGARSFSIWDTSGNLVFDSGDALEQITAAQLPDYFNSTNDDNDSFDNRSDDKGPEPEAATIGVVNGMTLAFIGLERIGGVMIFDVTDPTNVSFESYLNNRDFSVDADTPEAGDLGPEGLKFIPGDKSPTGTPLLAVANEVSGTTTVYTIETTTAAAVQPALLATEGAADEAAPQRKLFDVAHVLQMPSQLDRSPNSFTGRSVGSTDKIMSAVELAHVVEVPLQLDRSLNPHIGRGTEATDEIMSEVALEELELDDWLI
jgi:hypothetical protein